MNEYHVFSAFSPNLVLVPLHIYGFVQSEAIGQLPTLNEGLGPQCETSLLRRSLACYFLYRQQVIPLSRKVALYMVFPCVGFIFAPHSSRPFGLLSLHIIGTVSYFVPPEDPHTTGVAYQLFFFKCLIESFRFITLLRCIETRTRRSDRGGNFASRVYPSI